MGFRKGIDGLAGICRQILEADPFSGCVFVFRNSRGTAIKALNVRVKVRVHRYLDGSMAIFHGPRKLADYDPRGKLKEMKKAA